nr:ATP-NAD kinase [Desulfurococcales archaeon]
EKTLLGVDAVHNGVLLGRDLDERAILSLIDRHKGKVKIVLSPIGGQGYILGRGNQQISPEVVRRVGKGGIIVVATPSKLSRLKVLRVDTGDYQVDEMLRGPIRVITGYRRESVVRVETE